jgi:hypothetical protein
MAAAIKIEEAIRRRGLPCPPATGLLMALPAAQARSGSGSCLAGKTLTIVVDQVAGQPRDPETRLYAEFLERDLPGHPRPSRKALGE